MKKDTLIGGAVLVVIVLGVFLYGLLRPTTSVPAPAPVTEIPGPTLSGSSYKEQGKYYTIDVQYASSTPLSEPANTAAVTLMKNFIRTSIAELGIPSETDAADGTYQLKIVYLMASSAHTLSYIYTIYGFTGGAHGNTDFKTFTFDTETGTPLALADLFLPGTDYLGTLSQLARARLPVVIGDGYDMNEIKDGTAPTPDNFRSFFFDNGDFVVLFPPYQVAAYSEGPQTLRIPVSLLSSILKPQYR